MRKYDEATLPELLAFVIAARPLTRSVHLTVFGDKQLADKFSKIVIRHLGMHRCRSSLYIQIFDWENAEIVSQREDDDCQILNWPSMDKELVPSTMFKIKHPDRMPNEDFI